MPLLDNAPWERLYSVIGWSNMTTNHFASHIGLANSENLYRIKRGLNGISRRLAETIVTAFPEIDYTWLISGNGVMFTAEALKSAQIEYYDRDMERELVMIDQISPRSLLSLPSSIEADFAMLYVGDAMGMMTPPNSIVMLKRVELDSVIFGKEYLVECDQFSLLRIVRSGGESSMQLRLRAFESDKYDDIVVRREAVKSIYRVMAKVIVNS